MVKDYDYDNFIFRFAVRDWLSLCEDLNLYRADSFWTDSFFIRLINEKNMFVKTRKVKEGDGISIDPLGVIYRQTDKGLILEGLDEYSALLPRSGWYVEDYHVAIDVVEIGPWAFSSAQFKKISLPDGLQVIRNGAFNNCQFLEEIVIPDSVTYVDSDAFYQCKSIKKVTLPNSMGLESPYMDHNPFFSNEELYKEFLDTSLDSLECIYIPKDKREMLSTLLPHLTHLFVDK